MVKLGTTTIVATAAVLGLAAGWFASAPKGDRRPSRSGAFEHFQTKTLQPSASTVGAAAPESVGKKCTVHANPHFVDRASELGVVFTVERGETGNKELPETMGFGCAWIDFDLDGLLDLFFVQGGRLDGQPSASINMLFRNRGERFEAIPDWAAPARDRRYGMGVACGDVDNDGFEDIYVANYGVDTFYRNNGDGTFLDRTDDFGLGCPLFGTSAAFGDLDRDGDLDLVVANYVWVDPNVVCVDGNDNRRVYCGPDYYKGQPLAVFENLGNGRFRDIAAACGAVHPESKGLGVVIADLVGDDGYPEIFAANDLKNNLLLVNESKGEDAIRFREAGVELGAAVNGQGAREANMGIACADVDRDGRLDLYVTHFHMETDTLWRNLGSAGFADVTKTAGFGPATRNQLSWGANFFDYDNNGWLDLFVTSGHLNEQPNGTIPYAMRPQLFRNLALVSPRVQFVECSSRAGDYFERNYVGRGSAVGDYDNDGRLDLVVTHHFVPASIIHNETQTGHSIGFDIVGAAQNRTGVGVRIYVVDSDGDGSEPLLFRELIGGGSYLSADARRVMVGVGHAREVDVQVRWDAGSAQKFSRLRAGRSYLLVEGRGLLAESPWSGSSAHGEE